MIYIVLFYFLFLIIFVGYSAAGIYHLWRYGFVGDLTRPMIVVYSLLSIGIIVTTLFLLLVNFPEAA